jgi:lipopolysaccharide/colanic/teichoic acid biosynthesis glycosyltransferase
MIKRLMDIAIALPAAVISAPVLAVLLAAVWLYDRHNPLYVPRRVGKDGKLFPLFKIRTMVVDADKTGIDTTIKGDPRLLPFAETMRRCKLDELPQFWNVLLGHMSLVGPRPNVIREVEKYTEEERRLLSIKPGLTDFASIVFADLSERLAGQDDANLAYETMIRPQKARLGLFYVDNHTVAMDIALIAATAMSLVSRTTARRWVERILSFHGLPPEPSDVARHGQL